MGYQPALKLSETSTERALKGVNGVLILLGFGLAAAHYPDLPDRIPTHFNLWGNPDSYGSKTGIFVLPALNLLIVAGLLYLMRFPHKINYLTPITAENAENEYRKGRILLLAVGFVVGILLVFLNWNIIRVGLSESAGLSKWVGLIILACIGAPFAAIWRMNRNPKRS
jgi:uncharacterized membrane protein